MAYILNEKLPMEAVTELTLLCNSIKLSPATNRHRHIGAGGGEKASQYNFSRWYEWDRHQRNHYKAFFQPKHIEKAIVGWFLQLQANVGFIDKMTQWVNQPNSGTIVAYALNNNQKVVIGERQYILNMGQGIAFNVSEIHEVPKSPTPQLWACIMIPGNIDRLNQ